MIFHFLIFFSQNIQHQVVMSFTPDVTRKSGVGVIPSPAPFLTPRPERRRPDSSSSSSFSSRLEREKDVNVQVLLRCRPLSEEEQKSNVPRVISCNELRKEVSVANKQVDRLFTFDKVRFFFVFSPLVWLMIFSQRLVYLVA